MAIAILATVAARTGAVVCNDMTKYRAWHKAEKKMFEVVALEWEGWAGDALYSSRLRVNIKRKPRLDGYGFCLEWCTEDEVILMESIGLEDINHKEIFRELYT